MGDIILGKEISMNKNLENKKIALITALTTIALILTIILFIVVISKSI